MKRRILATLLCFILAMSLAACGSSESTSKQEEEPKEEEEKKEETETEKEEPEEADEVEEESDEWDAGDLAYLGLTRDEIMDIYNYYMELIDDPSAADLTGDDIAQYEDECKEKTAEKFGITTEDVDNIFFASLDEDFFATFDTSDVKMKYGELKDIVVADNGPSVSAKITSSTSNENAIEQCYYDACDFIRNYAGTDYDEVTFAGYADFQNGDEMKFIQFTVPKNVIETIATGKFADNTLGDYVDDLWIIESMR